MERGKKKYKQTLSFGEILLQENAEPWKVQRCAFLLRAWGGALQTDHSKFRGDSPSEWTE